MSAPTPPQPAATVLLVRDDPFEVLMVRRPPTGSFRDALVFPGGMVDPADADAAWCALIDDADGMAIAERAVRIAALRETYEETGLLIVAPGDGGSAPAPPGADFRAAVRARGGRLPLQALVPFAHWITPEVSARRWDTRFFIAAAPPDQTAVHTGDELAAIEWIAPATMLARDAAGEEALLFPTRLNLARLAESGCVADALAAARRRPAFTVLPRVERRGDGVALLIPAEAGYGIVEDARRRLDP